VEKKTFSIYGFKNKQAKEKIEEIEIVLN